MSTDESLDHRPEKRRRLNEAQTFEGSDYLDGTCDPFTVFHQQTNLASDPFNETFPAQQEALDSFFPWSDAAAYASQASLESSFNTLPPFTDYNRNHPQVLQDQWSFHAQPDIFSFPHPPTLAPVFQFESNHYHHIQDIPPLFSQENADFPVAAHRSMHCQATLQPILPQIPHPSSSPTSINCLAKSKTNDIVCFGMIPPIRGKCDKFDLSTITSPFLATLTSENTFTSKDNAALKGIISSDEWKKQMIQDLVLDESLHTYVRCSISDFSDLQKPARKFGQISCDLEITVYGPPEEFEDIGNWFQQYDVYLQDPLVCHLDARYCNPHKLSSDEHDLDCCPWLSEVVPRLSTKVHLQDITTRPDLLDILSSRDDLEEAHQPKAITSQLKRHQKQALTFMIQREQGWCYTGDQADIWKFMYAGQDQYFVNMLSGTHQVEEPPECYGGIMADPMGLGKTLTMIALAAWDLEVVSDRGTFQESQDTDNGVPATLIIIPPPLVGSWEEQLDGHVLSGSLRCLRHHGKTRLKGIQDLDGVNIVLTTYHTVSAEWKSKKETSILFGVHWRRIILDEAHYIRNENSRMASSVCALEARSRWAVTGTPIQNRLSDLATLVKFIRAYPYTETKQFEMDVSRLWKSGDDEEAVKRLQYLSSCLILRRPKTTITLPARYDKLRVIDFTQEERATYEQMRQQVIQSIDEALHNESSLGTSRIGTYVNVLQQIESLRLFCDLGLRYHSRHQKILESNTSADWNSMAQQFFNTERQKGVIICFSCSSTLELTESLLDDELVGAGPQLSQCLKYVCGDCTKKLRRTGRSLACGHNPACPTAIVSLSSSALEEHPDSISAGKTSFSGIPSKVKALVEDIRSLPQGTKSIVFSTWRLTLDIVEEAMRRDGIRSLRFDGKVSQKDRQSVVERFRSDPTYPVMLLTLSCGAVGLTLTVASRAYLMEPHWNPNIEEQALARVHRIGQTSEVTTVRLYIRDSFEEEVRKVQDTKKQLAGILLSPHDGSQMDDKLGSLQKLRSLL